ncbi:MAG: redoxin domain-containing protein [Planctomycetota bacterium]
MKYLTFITALCLLALLPLSGCGEKTPAPGETGEPSAPAKEASPEPTPAEVVKPAVPAAEPANPPAEPAVAENPEEEEPKPAISSAIESLTGSLGYNLDGQEEGDPKSELEKGLSLQKQGRYTKALEVLGRAVAMKGEESLRAEILLELAETYFRRGRDAQQESLEPGEVVEEPDTSLETSAVLFKEVARRYKTELDFSTQAAYMAGSCYLLLGDHQRGLKAYKSAFEDIPRTSKYRSKALERAGVCYAGVGNHVQARLFFEKYIRDYGADSKLAYTVTKIRNKYLPNLTLTGRPAPPIRATSWLNGHITGGLEELRGEVVVVTFFSTWCNHCKSELPRLRKDVEKWSKRGAVFIGVANPSDPKGKSPVDVYVKVNEVPFFDVALDEGGRSWRPYHVSGLPAAAIIDQDGILRWRGHYTFMGQSLLEELLPE